MRTKIGMRTKPVWSQEANGFFFAALTREGFKRRYGESMAWCWQNVKLLFLLLNLFALRK